MNTFNNERQQQEYYFSIFAPNAAKDLFKKLDDKFDPLTFLINFNVVTQSASIVPNPPSNYDELVLNLHQILPNVNSFNIEEYNYYISKTAEEHRNNPNLQVFIETQLKLKEYIKNVEKHFDSYLSLQDIMTFCSKPIIVQNNIYFIVIQLQKSIVNSYYSLINDINFSVISSMPKSLIQSAVNHFINKLFRFIKDDEYINNFELLLAENIFESLYFAGSKLMNSLSCKINNSFNNLYICFNDISIVKYEKKDCLGQLILAPSNHSAIKYEFKFENPLPLNDPINNHRKIRKLIETSTDKLKLICDSNHCFGLGYINYELYNCSEENIFEVSIDGYSKWSLKHCNDYLMAVENGIAQLFKNKFDRANFNKIIKQNFEISHIDLNELGNIVEKAILQKKGTTILISNNAKQESQRLKNQCFQIHSFKINAEYILNLTSIDGAIIIDSNLYCYAIGAILDGIASGTGDSARGSRYNSAKTYINTQHNSDKNNKIVVIVISEDGMHSIIDK